MAAPPRGYLTGDSAPRQEDPRAAVPTALLPTELRQVQLLSVRLFQNFANVINAQDMELSLQALLPHAYFITLLSFPFWLDRLKAGVDKECLDVLLCY